VTEAEWLESDEPHKMTVFLWRAPDARKFRLFVCAVCRQWWTWLKPSPYREAVELAERFADGNAGEEQLKAAETAILTDLQATKGAEHLVHCKAMREAASWFVWYATLADAQFAATRVTRWTEQTEGHALEREAQCRLLRDIFGNPFGRAVLSSAWLSPRVTSLAHRIYETRSFDRLPLLAGALTEAGCNITDILDHCREPAEHARGCWVLDLLRADQGLSISR
jgi:hypothetical protein